MISSFAALLAMSGTAWAAGACGGVQLTGSVVKTGLALPAALPLDSTATACLAEIGRELSQRGGLRTVTVSVRVDDLARGDGTGRKLADAYAAALAGGGVQASRVSALVPALPAGQAPSVGITFTERPAGPPVAVVDAASGTVSTGQSPTQLAPVQAGATLQANRFVQTGAGSSAMLGLADGSWVKLGPSSLVLIGELYVGSDLKRVVKLDVLSGSVDADVAKSGGSFEIGSRAGVAGVRGTEFRVTASSEGGDRTRVETTEGAVALEGSAGGQVELPAGMGSQVAAGAPPEEARKLIKAPEVVGPVNGRRRGEALSWDRVRKADHYVVQLSRDAEFISETRQLDAYQRTMQPGLDEGGTWFWRVAGVDSDGFLGQWSKVYAFEEGGGR